MGGAILEQRHPDLPSFATERDNHASDIFALEDRIHIFAVEHRALRPIDILVRAGAEIHHRSLSQAQFALVSWHLQSSSVAHEAAHLLASLQRLEHHLTS